MFVLEPTPDFQGLRDDVPLEIYQRHLPHWRQAGATYFVTFRLADALPAAKQQGLADARAFWLRKHPPPHSAATLEAFHRHVGMEAEKWLDRGMGSCLLAEARYRQALVNALFRHDISHFETPESQTEEARFQLGAFVIMPNHVHLLVRPLRSSRWPLQRLIQMWKGQSARAINQLRGTQGSLWFDESYDRIVRDPEHLWRCLQYIGRNPFKAGLPANHYARWVRPEWASLHWKFEDP
jgi:REP element-mobilizing transposase RayT